MEQLIAKFKLPMIENLSLINVIVSMGYRKTGNKFSVNFNGSKGYLSNIEILCEGIQKERNNIIWVESLKTKKGNLMSKMVSIFYSENTGIRVVLGEKQPKIIKTKKEKVSTTLNEDCDLPF